MDFQREELGGGVFVNIAHTERFKTDSLTIYLILPLHENTLSAYSLLPEVLRTSCEAYASPRQMACRLQELYDTAASVTQYHMGPYKILAFSMDMLAGRYLPGGTDLLTDASDFLRGMLCRPLLENGHFRAQEVSLRKTAMIDAVRALINRKAAYALMRCRYHMCQGDTVALLPYGTEDMLEAVTPETLTNAYQALFSRARVECFFEGRAPQERVKEALSFLVGDGSCEADMVDVLGAPSAPRAQVLRVTEKMSAKQGRLVLGLRCPVCRTGEEEAAFAVMLELLAYSPVSRLFMRVREALGLCYSCSASYDLFRGHLFLVAGIDNDSRDKTERAMMAQVRQIGRRRFTDDEFEAAKSSIVSALKGLDDAPDTLELRTLKRRLADLSVGAHDHLSEQADALQAVTAAAVARAAKSLVLDTVYFLEAEQGEDCEEEEGDD